MMMGMNDRRHESMTIEILSLSLIKSLIAEWTVRSVHTHRGYMKVITEIEEGTRSEAGFIWVGKFRRTTLVSDNLIPMKPVMTLNMRK